MGLAGLTGEFATVLADPPWRFVNRTGNMAPEHRRLARYQTMQVDEVAALGVSEHLTTAAHCYLWCPNALLAEGLTVLKALGFTFYSCMRETREKRPNCGTPARVPGTHVFDGTSFESRKGIPFLRMTLGCRL